MRAAPDENAAPEEARSSEAVVRGGAEPSPWLTISEATEATGVGRSVLRRLLLRGSFPGAFKDDRGTWRIPEPDLVTSGLLEPQDEAGESGGEGREWQAPEDEGREWQAPEDEGREWQAPEDEGQEWERLEAEVERVRAENDLLRERLRAVTALAEERERRIEDLRLALQAIPSVFGDSRPATLALGERSAAPTLPADPRERLEVELWSDRPRDGDPRAEIEALRTELEAMRAARDRLVHARRRWWRRSRGLHTAAG